MDKGAFRLTASALALTAPLAIAGLAHAADAAAAADTTAPIATAVSTVPPVTITAERRTINLQTAPLAATVISGSQLKVEGITTVDDLQFHSPSVVVADFGQGSALQHPRPRQGPDQRPDALRRGDLLRRRRVLSRFLRQRPLLRHLEHRAAARPARHLRRPERRRRRGVRDDERSATRPLDGRRRGAGRKLQRRAAAGLRQHADRRRCGRARLVQRREARHLLQTDRPLHDALRPPARQPAERRPARRLPLAADAAAADRREVQPRLRGQRWLSRRHHVGPRQP